MKKTAFFNYTWAKVLEQIANMRSENLFPNVTAKIGYNRAEITTKGSDLKIYVKLSHRGNVDITVVDFCKNRTTRYEYYIWEEDTATEKVAEQLVRDIRSCYQEETFGEMRLFTE